MFDNGNDILNHISAMHDALNRNELKSFSFPKKIFLVMAQIDIEALKEYNEHKVDGWTLSSSLHLRISGYTVTFLTLSVVQVGKLLAQCWK